MQVPSQKSSSPTTDDLNQKTYHHRERQARLDIYANANETDRQSCIAIMSATKIAENPHKAAIVWDYNQLILLHDAGMIWIRKSPTEVV